MDTFLIQSVIFCLDSVIASIFQTYDEAKVKASRKVQLPWQDGQLDMDTPNAAYSPKYELFPLTIDRFILHFPFLVL